MLGKILKLIKEKIKIFNVMWVDGVIITTKDYKFTKDYNEKSMELNERFIEHSDRLINFNTEILDLYKKLYNTVDSLFYDIDNQWEDGMDIEQFVAELRQLMYGEES